MAAANLLNNNMTRETKQMSSHETHQCHHHNPTGEQLSTLVERDSGCPNDEQQTATRQTSVQLGRLSIKQQLPTTELSNRRNFHLKQPTIQSGDDDDDEDEDGKFWQLKIQASSSSKDEKEPLFTCQRSPFSSNSSPIERCLHKKVHLSSSSALTKGNFHYNRKFVWLVLLFSIAELTLRNYSSAGLGYASAALMPKSSSIIASVSDDLTTPQQIKHQAQPQPQSQNPNQEQQQQVAADVIAIKEGADLDLSCPIVVQNEDMIISWTCDNEPANIRSSRIHVTDSGKLRIRSAKIGDSCNYRCEAADGYGTLSVIIKVLIVDKKLMEELSTRDRAVPANGTGSADIVADSNRTTSRRRHELDDGRGKAGQKQRQSSAPQKSIEQTSATNTNSSNNDIEIYIEPAQVRVAKNKTFNLECRVVPPTINTSSLADGVSPQLPAPQIIWLKEFIGPKPSSLPDALEQNLILLDDVYYHSLNWPRSITYSQKSTGSSSALLIRQSSYIHSGRYVCFAGYPPPSMATSLVSRGTSEQQDTSSGTSSVRLMPTSFRPFRYKLARAVVEVDDEEGRAKSNSAFKYSGLRAADTDEQLPMGLSPQTTSLDRTKSQTKSDNLFMRVITNNSWMRNLTITVTLLSALIIIIQFIRFRMGYKLARRSSIAKHPGSADQGQTAKLNPIINPTNKNNNVNNSEQQLPPRQVFTRSLPIDEDMLRFKLNDCVFNQQNHQTEVKSLEHIYSEINSRDN